jgi:hypothetical protein
MESNHQPTDYEYTSTLSRPIHYKTHFNLPPNKEKAATGAARQ